MSQGDPEWFEKRSKIPTASEFSRFATNDGELRKGRNKDAPFGLAEGALTYLSEKLAERVAEGWAKSSFKGSPDIERGHELEHKARKFLAFEIGQDIDEVGICISDCGRFASSPDGLIGGLVPVELKAPDFHTAIRYQIEGGGVPDEYIVQCHGHLVVTGAPHMWFCAYTVNTRIPNILVRVERDQVTERLAKSVATFCDYLDEAESKFLT